MRKLGIVATAGLMLWPAAALADETDAAMRRFFAIWENDAGVTRKAVAAEYADHVIYYGKSMTNAEVYADKLAYIRRWPDRHYREVPGSATRSCDAGKMHCFIAVTLAYDASGPGHHSSGRPHIDLTLQMSNGQWKIVKEAGRAR